MLLFDPLEEMFAIIKFKDPHAPIEVCRKNFEIISSSPFVSNMPCSRE